MGYTAMMAAFWAILIIFLLSFLRRETRFTPVALLSAFEEGAKSTLTVGMACACAGIIIGSIYLSGLGMRFAQIVVVMAGGKLWLTLIYVVFVSLLLGMGMPAAAVYLTLATIVIPALIMLGVTPIAAHLFCFYYGAISGITPPVALAAFAGGAISGESPTKTSYHAFKIGIAAYIIPFMFIYNNSMLMIGSVFDILWVLVTTLCGVFFLAAGVEGWMMRKACIPERIAMIVASVVVIKAGLISDVFGFGLMGILVIIQLFTSYPESIDQWTVSLLAPFRNMLRRNELS